MTETLIDCEGKRDALVDSLKELGDFRRGTITANYRKCGKPNCACTQEGHPGHGPQYLWSATIKHRFSRWFNRQIHIRFWCPVHQLNRSSKPTPSSHERACGNLCQGTDRRMGLWALRGKMTVILLPLRVILPFPLTKRRWILEASQLSNPRSFWASMVYRVSAIMVMITSKCTLTRMGKRGH